MKSAMKWIAALAASLVAATAGASTITYYHNDLAGSPVAATDSSGHVIWRESYRPYGERLTNSASATDNSIWFTSHRQDRETGLVYLGARYYDPMAGRFVSMDPKAFDEANLHSFNRYAYANNNPYKYVDPDGRTPQILWAVGGYGAGVLADAASQYAAWGSVDWKMAMSSSAALSGVGAGLMGPGGGGVGLTIERVGAEATAEVAAAARTASLEKQAANLIQANGGKNRVTMRSPSRQIDVDLAGNEHGGIPTPHVKISPRNTQAPPEYQPAYNTSAAKSTLRAATQEDIRMVRRYLERR